ncbi:MAG: hypothetical protein AB2556_21590 [Candidatus Thiodiazotropha sp.]
MWNSKHLLSGLFSVTLSLFSLTANALTVSGNQEVELPWGEVFVDVYDTSTLNINNFHGASFIDAYQQSTVNAYDAGMISWLNMRDNSIANIHSGIYSTVHLFDNSIANLYGGFDTDWFLVAPDAQVNVFGRRLDYIDGRLNGMAANGTYFSLELSAVDNNGYILDSFPTNVTLNAVPLPAPLVLFISGLVVLARLGNRKRGLFGSGWRLQAAAN